MNRAQDRDPVQDPVPDHVQEHVPDHAQEHVPDYAQEHVPDHVHAPADIPAHVLDQVLVQDRSHDRVLVHGRDQVQTLFKFTLQVRFE